MFCETLEESNYRLQKELLEKQKEIDSLKRKLEEKEQTILMLEKHAKSVDQTSPYWYLQWDFIDPVTRGCVIVAAEEARGLPAVCRLREARAVQTPTWSRLQQRRIRTHPTTRGKAHTQTANIIKIHERILHPNSQVLNLTSLLNFRLYSMQNKWSEMLCQICELKLHVGFLPCILVIFYSFNNLSPHRGRALLREAAKKEALISSE